MVAKRWAERKDHPDETRSLQAGVYRNSNFETSAYLIMDWHLLVTDTLKFGFFGGLVTGYKGRLAAGLNARVDANGVSATLRASPRAYRTCAVLAFEAGCAF